MNLHQHFLIPALSAALASAPVSAQETLRVSVDSAGVGANDQCFDSSISADGSIVAFSGYADNLVPGDTNLEDDVFVRDLTLGLTTRVSVDSSGAQANGYCSGPAISGDARWVAFHGDATNLVAGDVNGFRDVFLHDRLTGATIRISVSSAGSEGDAMSFGAAVSHDGGVIAFVSEAGNLVLGDTNGERDVFVRDVAAGVTTRVSVGSSGGQANGGCDGATISADGRYVVFRSYADNLVPGDHNGASDVFLHDRSTGVTRCVSVNAAGAPASGSSHGPSLAADGGSVAFYSDAADLAPGDTNGTWDVYVHELASGAIVRASVNSLGGQGNAGSYWPSISGDGRRVAFYSEASNLVLGDVNLRSDVFVHDRVNGQTTAASVNSAGHLGNEDSMDLRLSADGQRVTFASLATNLVPGDTNDAFDVYLRDLGMPPVLTRAGICPGPITLMVAGAHPLGAVGLVHGAAGRFVKGNRPCSWLVLDIAQPTLCAVLHADTAGGASLAFTAPPGACGRTVQAVDVQGCLASNTVVL